MALLVSRQNKRNWLNWRETAPHELEEKIAIYFLYFLVSHLLDAPLIRCWPLGSGALSAALHFACLRLCFCGAVAPALYLCHTPEPLHDHHHFCTAPLAQGEATRTLTRRPFRWCASAALVDNAQRSTSRNENKINKQKNATKDGRGKSASTGR
jgi:hypothetical protein